MRNIWKKIIISIITCILLAGCSNNSTDNSTEDLSKEIIELLVKGDQAQVDTLKKSMPSTDLLQSWQAQTKTGGEYIGLNGLKALKQGKSHVVVEVEVEYSSVIFDVRMTFNEANQLVGFHIQAGTLNMTLPDTLLEEEVVVGKGTPYELGGTLTLPNNKNGKVPAVVLVHGSGPSDRDESVFAYKPFRDLAWGLADEGIAVLRYDKRTFTYGNTMSPEEINEYTVFEETVEDALRAAEFLKNNQRIDADNIFLIGHSLGGMLAPRIATEWKNFAGIVSLAGSPRPLWEIIYDQNMALIEGILDESTREEQEEMIQEQYKKAQQIEQMTTEEALKETVFGIPAHYFKEMDDYNPPELISELEIPVLVLQGEEDFQVYLEKDFAMWEELLADRENATLISYPGLNHFFIHYEGVGKGTIAEYDEPGAVDKNVIKDIASWMLEHLN